MTAELLKRRATENGAALVGFCELGERTLHGFPQLKYAVSIACRLSDTVLATITDSPTPMYFHHYRTVNFRLDQIALALPTVLEAEGYAAMPVAASQSLPGSPFHGLFPHKTAAVLAGLGYVGKSGLFLSREFGSKVRLATVLTNFPLQSELPLMQDGCGSCTLCRDACPAGAISGRSCEYGEDALIDAEKCSLFMKSRFQQIGRGSVCGICIRVCPRNGLPGRCGK